MNPEAILTKPLSVSVPHRQSIKDALMPLKRTLRMRQLLILAVLLPCFYCEGRFVVMSYLSEKIVAGRIDAPSGRADSPDGTYRARLNYIDYFTYGYYHVTVESKVLGYGRTDLVEVASEGLLDVSWRDRRTLVVDYDASVDSDHEEDTFFVDEPCQWADISIVYRPMTYDEKSRQWKVVTVMPAHQSSPARSKR